MWYIFCLIEIKNTKIFNFCLLLVFLCEVMASSTSDMPQSPYLGEGSPILDFKQVGDESLKEAWDRLLEI